MSTWPALPITGFREKSMMWSRPSGPGGGFRSGRIPRFVPARSRRRASDVRAGNATRALHERPADDLVRRDAGEGECRAVGVEGVPSGLSSPMNWKAWSKVARNLASLWRRASSASLRAVMSSTVATKPRNVPSAVRIGVAWACPLDAAVAVDDAPFGNEAGLRGDGAAPVFAHRCAFVGMEMLDPGAVEDFLERAVDRSR